MGHTRACDESTFFAPREIEEKEFDWGLIQLPDDAAELGAQGEGSRTWLMNGAFVRQKETLGLDLVRSFRFAAMSGFTAPMGHFWYNFLGRNLAGVGWSEFLERYVFVDLCERSKMLECVPLYPWWANIW